MSVSSIAPQGVQFNDFTVTIDKKKIIEVDSLVMPEKGVVAILGPSGCGKSTLLRVLSGIHDERLSYEGKLTEYGLQRTRGEQLQNYAMVWQTPTVFPCSVYDNLKIPLKKNRVPKSEWDERMHDALYQIGLHGEIDSRLKKVHAQQLSGGQRQRLCLAMGLLMNTNVLLLDEPTSALDPVATDKIENIIQSLGQQKLVILVTHSIGQARRVSDYSAIFCCDDGYGFLCESGKTENVLHTPESQQTRNFIFKETGT